MDAEAPLFHVTRDGVVEAQMHDDTLGALRVSAEQGEGGVSIVIRLDNAVAAGSMEAQRSQLVQALALRGIPVTGVSIVTGAVRGTGIAAKKGQHPDSAADAASEGAADSPDQEPSHGADRLNVRA